jgi:predicted AlkP superfamily phosphohydrolase/phosphomutase
MSKVVIIGIDGLDPFLLTQWKNDLPNVNRLFTDISEIQIESTFPPDSICAWTSIYTGENPAEHGLLESIDYLSNRKLSNSKDRSIHLKEKTFWDIAGRKGRTVCVLNPFLAYPAWKVNGIMVSGPVFEGGGISAYPESILKKYNFPSLGGIVDFPDESGLSEFIENSIRVTKDLAEVGLEIYKDNKPDLFFVAFLTLDRIKHFLWRFTDKEDNYYPGKNRFEDSIKHFYIMFDEIIGRFKEVSDERTILVIVSDHGHRRRCAKCLNLNDILRKKGYLSLSTHGAQGLAKALTEKMKVKTISVFSKYGLHDWIYKVARFTPNRKALKKSTYLIDDESSSVTLSELCGTNPFGGLNIKAKTNKEYDELREKIICELMELNKTLGENVFKWVKKREEIYVGKYEKKLPDVVFELDDQYGVGRDLFTSSITPNYTYKKISGGHKKEAVLLVCGSNGKINKIRKPVAVIGIKDYILKILNE